MKNNTEFNSVRDQAFISPYGENTQARKVLNTILDDLMKFLNSAGDRPLLPEALKYDFNKSVFQETPASFETIRASVQELFQHSMNPYNPFYIGHMDSMPTLYSIIGDLLTSALNNNLFGLEMSPFLTQLENHLVKEFCTKFGLPKESGGLILGGGSLVNLQALLVARNYALGDNEGNVKGQQKDLVIFCSDMAHTSVQKAAMIMGLGRKNVVIVKTDEQGKMIVPELERSIEKCKEQNQLPMAIVATAGTTVTGNIDPVAAIAAVAQKHSTWLHVDAIWGGALIFSKRHSHRLKGIERADSITFNPQKWMMVAKTCSLVLFRNEQWLDQYFRMKKGYVRDQSICTDLSELAITGTKRSQGLKLWLSLQSMGTQWLEQHIDRTMELSAYFKERIDQHDYLRLKTIPETAALCMRMEPKGASMEELNQCNENLQHFLLTEHNTFFSLSTLNGERWQRIILLNPYTDTSHIDKVFEGIDAFYNHKIAIDESAV